MGPVGYNGFYVGFTWERWLGKDHSLCIHVSLILPLKFITVLFLWCLLNMTVSSTDGVPVKFVAGVPLT